MLLGLIPMFCFGILRNYGGNRKNEENWKIWALSGSYVEHKEPTLRRRPTPRRGIPLPRRGQGAKMAPLKYSAA